MQQTDRAAALEFAVQFSSILFDEHGPDCECEPAELVTALHQPTCPVGKDGHCTCAPVLVHAPVTD